MTMASMTLKPVATAHRPTIASSAIVVSFDRGYEAGRADALCRGPKSVNALSSADQQYAYGYARGYIETVREQGARRAT